MCFSPEASFAAAAVLGPVGIASLRAVRRREQLLVGALPLLFAAHQLAEGVVWLGLDGHVPPGVRDAAIGAYLAFAQVAVPVLVPLAVLALERDRARRRWMAALLALGAVIALRMAWILMEFPMGARASDHVIVYRTDLQFGYVVATAYVVAACGPALLSTRPALRRLGAINVAGLVIAVSVRYSAVTSVWCLYAALASVTILAFLRRDGVYARSATAASSRSASASSL
jgi:uncharacterized membrane protein